MFLILLVKIELLCQFKRIPRLRVDLVEAWLFSFNNLTQVHDARMSQARDLPAQITRDKPRLAEQARLLESISECGVTVMAPSSRDKPMKPQCWKETFACLEKAALGLLFSAM